MIKLPEPAKRPTMYFVGVTTGQSSITVSYTHLTLPTILRV